MAKSISVPQKKRGRPATGKTPVTSLRLPDAFMAEIDKWSRKNGAATRSEAIRRLLELGLASASAKTGRASRLTPEARADRAKRARKAASETIERVLAGQPDDVKASRKRRLTKVPEELAKPRRETRGNNHR